MPQTHLLTSAKNETSDNSTSYGTPMDISYGNALGYLPFLSYLHMSPSSVTCHQTEV